MSVPNEARERALREAATPLADRPHRELATLGGALGGVERLAREIGATLGEALDRLWSWDVTLHRAADAVRGAQQAIDREHAEAEARRRQRKAGGRRRY